MRLLFIAIFTFAVQPGWAERLLVPMDDTQRDHLKSYGLAFWTLQRGIPVEWLLNYRGGAFLYDYHELIAIEAQIRGVRAVRVTEAQAGELNAAISSLALPKKGGGAGVCVGVRGEA